MKTKCHYLNVSTWSEMVIRRCKNWHSGRRAIATGFPDLCKGRNQFPDPSFEINFQSGTDINIPKKWS